MGTTSTTSTTPTYTPPQPTFETIATTHGAIKGDQLIIVHQADVGELLIAFFLAALTSTILLKWLFKAIWGR